MTSLRDKTPRTCTLFVGFTLCTFLLCQDAHADGSESLGPPSISIAAGTDILGAGAGLFLGSSTIDLEIPAGVTVEQVLLYWSGFHSSPTSGSDDTVVIAGTPVVGVPLGGPTLFFASTYCSTFRADITSSVTLTTGTNSLSIGGLAFDIVAHGASIFVIVDDGLPQRELLLFDGLDLAFAYFSPPLDATVPQSFDFPPVPISRTATLQVVVADVQPLRPNAVRVLSGGVETDHVNLLGSTSGPEWDHVSIDVTVPAGASSLAVQVRSESDGSTNLPSSFAWVATSLLLETPPPGDVSGKLWLDGNDNGISDPGEQGIAGVTIVARCAGLDGLFDTADDYVETQLTGSTGEYSFSNLPVGPCRVTVDASTTPVGLGPGACPMQVDLSVVYGVVAPGTDFCLAALNADFVRGDSNDDGVVDVSDVVFIARWVVAGGVAGDCHDAADCNLDLSLDLADAVFLASYLFVHGFAPGAPFPACGQGGDCAVFTHCP